MRRGIAGVLISALAVSVLFAEENLPTQDENEMLEIEPPLLIQSRGPDGLPILPNAPQPPDIAKLEGDLARAKKSAAAGEHLYKAGIIAKVEAEERALKVVRLQASLATAQLEEAKSKADPQNTERENTSPSPNGDDTEIAQAEQAAARAIEERRRAELEAALRNLQRQQKLLALGSGRKADVNRAEKKLAELQHAQN